MRVHRGILAAAILTALATGIVTAGASASASAGAAEGKKKCKHRRAGRAKRKCVRKKRETDAPRLPVVRATLTWSNGGASDVDMDLFVFDANGNRAGNGSNTIPLTSLTPDFAGPAGSETFTDSIFAPQAARDLSFGVCYTVGGSVHTDFTITYVTADGVVHGDTKAGDTSPGSSSHYDYPGGAAIPSGYCAN